MLFVVTGYFKPGAEAERLEIHERYNEHLMQRVAHVRFGGPLLDDNGARTGVMLVIDVADRQTAEAFLSSSPYEAAGLYARTDVTEIRPEIGSLRS